VKDIGSFKGIDVALQRILAITVSPVVPFFVYALIGLQDARDDFVSM
jgi:hypothetical protein